MCWAIFSGVSGKRRCGCGCGCGICTGSSLRVITRWVLSVFAIAFTSVAAITVTRAALTAFTLVLCGGATFSCGCVLTFCQCQIGRVGIARYSITLSTLTTLTTLAALATFTAAFTTAFATFTAAFTAGCALTAHFGAVGVQLGLGFCTSFVFVVAVVVATLATAFAWRTFTRRALALGAVAQFISAFTAGFATTTAFTRGTDFTVGTVVVFATATITTATAAIATAFTTLPIALVAALAVAA